MTTPGPIPGKTKPQGRALWTVWKALTALLALVGTATATRPATRPVPDNATRPVPGNATRPVPGLVVDTFADQCEAFSCAASTTAAAAAAAVTPRASSRVLADRVKVTHRPGTGPGHHALNMMFTKAPFPIRSGGAVVTFNVLFVKPFEFGCRGKVGGFGVGPGAADGGEHSPNGASHRLMWDAGGGAFAYVYVPSGTERRQPPPLREHSAYGSSAFLDKFRGALRDGVWHRVTLGLKLNSFSGSKPNADGELLLGIDGNTQKLTRVIWRQFPGLAIEHFGLGVFHGGPCHATRTSYSEYTNIEIHEY